MSQKLALQIVEQASAFAGISPPQLIVQRMKNCFAVYGPVSHRIRVDDRLVHELGDVELRALLAHEIGHAVQRRMLLRHAIDFLVPMVFGLCVFVPATICTAIWGTTAQMGLCTAAGMLAIFTWHKVAMPRWWKIVSQRERDADDFAMTFVDVPGALNRMSERCLELTSNS